MKKLLLIVAILTFSLGFAQTEKANYKTVVSEFQTNYNEGNYQEIYNMFNANLQKTLTLEKTKSFFKTNVKAEALGNITAVDLKEIIRTGHNYKFTFENGAGEAYFLLDDNNKISGLQMYPIQE
ncbi:uncharacterized protein DUF3887 [Lacinutrix venerupis]|uniref:DUF3887 domain-containing protein n=1 Tax=Lacinutrix venerupis TaxID=1486034 RepID=A0AAC9PW94_9FLAO|nr:DUF3887 domain-containing protein [Lacinutrix venerupis]APX99243.1 hypothetical protein BWR22_02605 [Lacinutrix venerupis]RLJ65621.1 uncharacterized protein DUF3887 [Lacinutrix venerupis]